MSVIEYRRCAVDCLLHLVWGQWSSLGVAGYAAPDREPIDSIDTEALILLTSLVGRCEQRLFDLMLDWLGVYGRLVSVQRLQTLRRRYTWVDEGLLGYVAAVCSRQSGDRRWQKLAGAYQGEPRPMFMDPDSRQPLFVARADEVALKHGWIRNVYIPSGKIAPQLPKDAATLLLQLRGCAGVNARAEILLLLLSGVGRPAELATRSAYAPSTVHDILSEMQLSGVIDDVSVGARQRDYALRAFFSVQAGSAVGRPCVRFPDWVRLFDGVARLWNVLMDERLAGLSDMTFYGEVNRIIRRYILPISRTPDFPPHLLRLIPNP